MGRASPRRAAAANDKLLPLLLVLAMLVGKTLLEAKRRSLLTSYLVG